MKTEPPLRFVYLTTPISNLIVLNLTVDGTHFRYAVTRDQLLGLNRQIADILVNNKFGDETAQLVLNLEKAATL